MPLDVQVGKVARELATLEEKMDRVLERAFGAGMQLPRRADSFRPAIDIYATGEATVIRVEIAGVEAPALRIVVDGEYVQISGRRVARYPVEPERHLQMEISEGSFERVIRARSRFDAERVSARLADGILSIELPHAPARSRDIPVKRT